MYWIACTDYPVSVPVWYLRVIPAVCGSLLIPAIYQISIALQWSRWVAALAALLVLLGMENMCNL